MSPGERLAELFAAGGSEPNTRQAVARGFFGRCPRCGSGRLFRRFLKPAESCGCCGQPFHHHRADDFPPYIVMFVIGHLIGYGIYTAETRFEEMPLWIHAVLWPTLAVGLSLALLQPVKGAVIGLQYGLRMHGFGALATEGAAGERRAWGAAENLLRGGGPGTPLAEPAAARRRDADRPGPAG